MGHVPGKGSVLLVEDDELLSRSIARGLRAGGWHVVAVHDGEAALQVARDGRHDVMLLDLRLPRIDGLRVLDAMRGVPSCAPVVLMSAYLDEEITLAARRGGAAEVLEKPFPTQRLFDVLGLLAERGALARDPVAAAEILVPEILGDSPAARALRVQVASVCRYRGLPVMVTGPTGTGKELVARAIHRLSGNSDKMVAINCAAMPEALFESELFGHEAGAFTGARGSRIGLLQEAGYGTVLLDEVGEMPPTQQAKLLRALETRTFRRVGSNVELPLHTRIVSATNRRIGGRTDEWMRSDLYFRLAVHTIRSPALSERREDIAMLARHFLEQFVASYACAPLELGSAAIDALHGHDWPGNIRELRAVVQSAAVRAGGHEITGDDVMETLRDRCGEPAASSSSSGNGGLPELEREAVINAYELCGGNLTRAAEHLRIPRSTLRDRVRRYGLR